MNITEVNLGVNIEKKGFRLQKKEGYGFRVCGGTRCPEVISLADITAKQSQKT